MAKRVYAHTVLPHLEVQVRASRASCAAHRADLCALAAAYGVGLAKNHAFLDGNKRTAFQVMYVFLGLNGLRIDAAEPEVVLLMFDVASGETGEEALAEWLRHRAGPR